MISLSNTLLLYYIITVVLSIIVALLIKLPLLPEKPIRTSWELSAIFPTPVIALGLLTIIFQFKIFTFTINIILAIVIGIISALFTKYLLEEVFPKPKMGDEQI